MIVLFTMSVFDNIHQFHSNLHICYIQILNRIQNEREIRILFVTIASIHRNSKYSMKAIFTDYIHELLV